MTIARVYKAITVACIVGAGAVAQGLIVGTQAAWVTLVVGALATAGVYRVPNQGDA